MELQMELEVEDIEDYNFDDYNLENVRVRKRYIRDGQNTFEFYNNFEFKRRYRFNKESVLYGILPRIEEGLAKINNRGLPIPPVMQLLICLRYATASFQLFLGNTMTVSQPTISRIVSRVTLLIASLLKEYIKMPQDEERRNENRRLFNDLGKGNGAIGLPGVDGAIDCTHVRLVDTRFQNISEIYRNRKGYFSLNVQTVVGPRMEFLDIVPEWPGSAHDSRIFRTSLLYIRYIENQLDGILVGDRGYPCLPFLMTPVSNPRTDEETCYNNIQCRTRLIVERTYGVWKRRFPCLSRGLTTKLITSTTIVVACAVLHNMSLIFNDVLSEDDDEFNINDYEEVPVHEPNNEVLDGFAAREALIARMFN
ncbi:putative nuclease HARBI1 [Temnothorax longispinosus]|uniref:putative nuclease HARBI1 n=1 Tax=Temnothorax longispinosus TaxID=300112 RepID=UPI003A99EA02